MGLISDLLADLGRRSEIFGRKIGHFRSHKMAGRICGSEKSAKSSSVGLFFVPIKYSLTIPFVTWTFPSNWRSRRSGVTD